MKYVSEAVDIGFICADQWFQWLPMTPNGSQPLEWHRCSHRFILYLLSDSMQMSDKETPQTTEETETFINNSWKRIFQLLVYYLVIISYFGGQNQ